MNQQQRQQCPVQVLWDPQAPQAGATDLRPEGPDQPGQSRGCSQWVPSTCPSTCRAKPVSKLGCGMVAHTGSTRITQHDQASSTKSQHSLQVTILHGCAPVLSPSLTSPRFKLNKQKDSDVLTTVRGKAPSPDLGTVTAVFLREREEGRERERNISVWLPLARPPLGTWPATRPVP